MIAIDTNVWLYCYDTISPEKRAIARQVIRDNRKFVLPRQVGCEFIAASRKLAICGLTESRDWEILEIISGLAELIAFPSVGQWNQAKELQEQYRVSFWDAVLFACCIENGVTKVYTKDVPSSPRIATLTIVNPFTAVG